MVELLKVIGGLNILAGLGTGIYLYVTALNHPLLQETLLTVILWTTAGLLSGIIYFALATILENQEAIRYDVATALNIVRSTAASAARQEATAAIQGKDPNVSP